MLREYDRGVEISDPERVGAGPFRGHDAFRAGSGEWMESWDEYDAEVEALVEVGDQVVLLSTTGPREGQRHRAGPAGALLVRLRDGQDRAAPAVHASRRCARGRRPHRRREVAHGDRDDLDGYEAWNRRDVDALAEMMEPDAEFVPIEQSDHAARSPVRRGCGSFFESPRRGMGGVLFTPVAFVPIGDARAGRARREGQGAWQRHRDRGALGPRLHAARRAAACASRPSAARRRRSTLSPILSGHEFRPTASS